LKNFFLDPEYRPIVRELAAELIAYGQKYKDDRISDAKIKADLEWSATGKGKFTPTSPTVKPKVRKKKGKGKK
jgi:hypothetical protein